MVLASATAGLAAPIDGVSTRLNDADALEMDLAHGRELGFAAKLCIHPRQVVRANAAMGPSAKEVAWAERVLAHAQDGVAVVDGAMVDAPVVARAQRIIRALGAVVTRCRAPASLTRRGRRRLSRVAGEGCSSTFSQGPSQVSASMEINGNVPNVLMTCLSRVSLLLNLTAG